MLDKFLWFKKKKPKIKLDRFITIRKRIVTKLLTVLQLFFFFVPIGGCFNVFLNKRQRKIVNSIGLTKENNKNKLKYYNKC